MLVLETPTKLRIPEYIAKHKDVIPLLTIEDTSAAYQLKRHQNQSWKISQMGIAAWRAEEQRLLARKSRSILFKDEFGYWVPSGCLKTLSRVLDVPIAKINRAYPLPEFQPLRWKQTPQQLFGGPPFEHQVVGVEALLESVHGSIEYATGTGKSLLFALLLRAIGLRAVFTALSGPIARQLYNLLMKLIGPKYIGYFDGESKEIGKLITVCTAIALSNVKIGSKAYDHFHKAEVFCGDEAHTFAADTLLNLSNGIMSNAPYRFFASATLIRGDGLGPILRSVVGDTVATLTLKEAVRRDILAKPIFGYIEIDPSVECASNDPDKITRTHLYEDPIVGKKVAQLGKVFKDQGYSVLYLVEEYPQVELLLKHCPDALVLHGNTGGAKNLPARVRECKSEIVRDKFNEGCYELIATSAGRVGIDLKPENPMLVVYLVGGTSEIALVQGVGRGTRRYGKDHFFFVDVYIRGVDKLEKHQRIRNEILTKLYETPQLIELD